MNGHADRPSTAIDHALDVLFTDLDQLTKLVDDGGLEDYSDLGQVGFFQRFEQFRNRLPVIDHRAIRDAQARNLAEQLMQTSMTRVLTNALRISAGEAARRVQASEALVDRESMLSEPLDPRRPVLAAAQRAGEITPEQVQIIVKALGSVDRAGFDPADIDAGEVLLAEQAQTFGPKELGLLAQRVVDRIDPDGSKPKDELNRDRRHFTMRATRDGAYTGEFRLTGSLGAKLATILGPLARPRSEKLPAPGADPESGETVSPFLASDDRTRGQRMHDALEELSDRILRAGSVPDSGGTPASVIVTIDLDNLIRRSGHGTTADGTSMSVDDLLQMADEAEVIPTVCNATGAVLNLGRARRIASPSQTYALYARDRGCSFPGCAHPPEWCERHHVKAWIDGGLTDLDNLALLCSYHHHNFATRGWACRIDDGLPEWIPPRRIDPQQRPMINERIRAARVA